MSVQTVLTRGIIRDAAHYDGAGENATGETRRVEQ